MKKVYLDNLPKLNGNNKVNWKKCSGYKVKFIYDDIEDELEIINYNKDNHRLNIIYKNNNYFVNISTLLYCSLGEILKKKTKDYKYNVGEIIEVRTGNIMILEQIKILHGNNERKGYIYKCLIDNNIDRITESSLNNKQGCNVCSNKKSFKRYK